MSCPFASTPSLPYHHMMRLPSILIVVLLSCLVDGSNDIRGRKTFSVQESNGRRLLVDASDKNDTTQQSNTLVVLKELQRKINLDYDPKKWGVHPDGSYSFTTLATRLVTSQFDYLIGDLPVFVYDAPTHTDNFLGNRLGNYFEAVTCANMAGLHFVCLTNQTDANKLAQGLPTIIVHPSPAKVTCRGGVWLILILVIQIKWFDFNLVVYFTPTLLHFTISWMIFPLSCCWLVTLLLLHDDSHAMSLLVPSFSFFSSLLNN